MPLTNKNRSQTYLLRDFEIQTDNLISARRPDPVIVNKKKKKRKKENLWNSEPSRLGRPQSKIKRKRKKYKYQNLARELKKLWNMKMTVIPIVFGALGTVTKGLV